MIDIRTEKEKERDARNARIRAEYNKIKSEMPDTPDIRIYKIIARRYRIVWNTVRYIIINNK